MTDGKIVMLVVAAVAAAFVYSYYAARKRRKLLAQWAAAKGFSFDGSRTQLEGRFPFISCLSLGRDRYAYNVVVGQWQQKPFTAFDYHYVTGSGKNRRTHVFSAVVIEAKIPLKPLLIRPENFLDKITEFFGAEDINFESGEFSSKYVVKAEDRRWAYDVLHPRTIEFLLQWPPFTIQFGLMHVIAYRNKTLAPADMEEAADVICGILFRLPKYLIQQQAGG